MFFYLKYTQMFGPIFKMIEQMTKDLGKFMVIWMTIILMFGCVGLLMFGELEAFQSLFPTLIMLFESSLGEWNMEIY
jgi:uncharacterized membrane protein (DUF373 family)